MIKKLMNVYLIPVSVVLASSRKLAVIDVNAISASLAWTVRLTMTTAIPIRARMARVLMELASTCVNAIPGTPASSAASTLTTVLILRVKLAAVLISLTHSFVTVLWRERENFAKAAQRDMFLTRWGAVVSSFACLDETKATVSISFGFFSAFVLL